MLSQEKWLSIIEKKTVLPTPYIRLFKDGMYDGRRYFPSCDEETEMGKDARTNPTTDIRSTTEETETIDTNQDNSQVSNYQYKSPCVRTQPINSSAQTPKISHQLCPLSLFPAKNDTVNTGTSEEESPCTTASIE